MDSKIAMLDTYQEYYDRVNKSKAFSIYCKRVFGIDLSQDGFSDKKQLDFMIDKLNINESDFCLDIGCGNGRIADYINRKTNAVIDGIDYSNNAIEHAKKFEQKNKNLHFKVEEINNLCLDQKKYSVAYLIDSIYFSNNYEKTLSEIYNSLTTHGRMGIFYSDVVFDEKMQTAKIHSDQTEIAVVLNSKKWEYHVYDFTNDHYKHMKKKNRVSNELKEELINEGNEWLYQRINRESVKQDMPLEKFEKFTNRYLYCIWKT